MIYFDAAYITKCYVAEPGSEEVLELAQSHPGRACAIHGRAEFFSAIRRHVREANLPRPEAEKVLRQFLLDEAADLWSFLPLHRGVVEAACVHLSALPDAVPCRAADALHLMCAMRNGFQAIYSNDRHLLAAAPHFGIEGINVVA